jgi:hypothetical protein
MTCWQAPLASPASSLEASRAPEIQLRAQPFAPPLSSWWRTAARRQGTRRFRSKRPPSQRLFPLTARCSPPAMRASRSEHPRKVELISLHQSFVCLHVSSARIAVPITTGLSLRARRDRTATVRGNIRSDCVAGVCTPVAVASNTFLTLTGRSRSIRTSGDFSVCVSALIAES